MNNSIENQVDRLVKNSALFAIGDFASKVIVFLMVPLYTYALSTEQYSISDLITTTVALASPFFSFVIYEAVMRFTLDKNSDKKVVFSIGFWIFVWGTLLLTVVSYITFQYITILRDYWLLFISYYVAFTLYNIVSGFVKGLEHVKLFTIAGIVHTIIMVVLNLAFLLWLKWGVVGYLLASIISSFIALGLLVYKDRIFEYLILPFHIKRKDWKAMLKYACPMIPNSAMWWINNSSDRYLVTYLVSSAANGIYSVAYKIPSIFSVLTAIFMQAWQISVVDDFGTKQGTVFFNKTYDFFFRASITISCLLILLSKFLAKFLFLHELYIAWKFSVVLILGFCFHSISGFLGTIYTTAKQTNMLFVSTSIAAVFNIIFTFIFIKFWGVMGAAIATSASYFLVYIIRRIDGKKHIDISSNVFLFAIEIAIMTFQAVVVILDFIDYSWLLSLVSFFAIIILNRDITVKLIISIHSKLKKIECGYQKLL